MAGAAILIVLSIAPILARRYGRMRIGGWVGTISNVGYALPGIVVALALVSVASQHLHSLYQTIHLLLIAYIIRFLPLSIHTLDDGLEQQSPRLFEAARSLGCGPLAASARVVLPNAWPAMLAAFAAVFIAIAKELPATLLLSPIEYTTLSTRIWSLTENAYLPEERGAKRLLRIREAFAAARAYVESKQANPDTPTDVRWEAMRKVLAGERPVLFLADDYLQIVSALDFAKTERLKAVIVGGRDAPLCADLLKERKVPVIVRGIHAFPRRNDSDVDEIYTLPRKLEKAGIEWCLASGERTANERNLPYTAGRAVAFGLPRDAAIAAITVRAARILGLGDELGTLKKGARATLFVCDGDPLEIPTNVGAAWIDGRRIDLSNKQTALAKKYRQKLNQER